MLRYGWSLSVSNAKTAMKEDTSIDFLIRQAAILHFHSGYIGDVQTERYIEVDN